MNFNISIEYDRQQIPVVAKLVCHARTLVDAECPASGKMELAVVEMLTNIMNYSDIKDGLIDIQCRFDGQDFTVTFSDEGKRLSSAVVSQYTNDEVSMPKVDIGSANVGIPDLPESGWGIQLIKSVCDDVSYNRIVEKNVFKLTFDLTSETA